MTSTQPARGMRDFLPEEVRRREYVTGVVRQVYEAYGFEPLETPAVENIETLLGKYGEEGNRLIFKILKRGEQEASGAADLALRYDLTVPLARVVAEHQAKLPRVFKRYQIQPVWRADRPARGRFREFCQCDIDAIGSNSLMVEAELCAAAGDVLTRLGFADFAIRLNHRLLLTAMLNRLGVPEGRHEEALVALDKWDKVGTEGVERELAARGIEPAAAQACLGFLARVSAAEGGERLELIRAFVQDSEEGRRGVADMVEIHDLLPQTGHAARIRFDPSLARGLSYYTGAIMEIVVPDLAGSLGGGGRYDNLIGMFLGRKVPACGFSLGLERMLVVMGERGMFPPASTTRSADIMVTVWDEATRAEVLGLATVLRAGGLRVDVYPDVDKLGKQFKYASSRQVPLVAVLGEDERARGEVTVKDMRTGEQQRISRAAVVAYVRRRLAMDGVPADPALRVDTGL
jgi:histidyl-tRNA synthetase